MKGKEKKEEGKGEREGRRNKSIRHSDKKSLSHLRLLQAAPDDCKLLILFVCSLIYNPAPQIPSLTSHCRQLEQSCASLIGGMAHSFTPSCIQALGEWPPSLTLHLTSCQCNKSQQLRWRLEKIILHFYFPSWNTVTATKTNLWKDVRGMWGEQSYPQRPSATGQHLASTDADA